MTAPAAVMVTGASGFLGEEIVRTARRWWPKAAVLPIASPRRGGPDLGSPSAGEWLRKEISLPRPEDTLLIHAAARVEWSGRDGVIANSAMALEVASWAAEAGLGFSILVSGVNVYPRQAEITVDTRPRPANLYGLGKVTAEEAWRLILPAERHGVVRLAGIWGWQPRPTLFWNSLLLAAAGIRTTERIAIRRRASRRNYISVTDAAECLLGAGAGRIAGVLLGAGLDTISLGVFVRALEGLPGSRLQVEYEDDGQTDAEIYHHSPELGRWLRSFDENLANLWAAKPDGTLF
jgi:nucleoside-diphosphate-sugar epimerase